MLQPGSKEEKDFIEQLMKKRAEKMKSDGKAKDST